MVSLEFPGKEERRMSASEDSSQFFHLFAQLGMLFQARFLRPLWQKYSSRDTDDWEAVGLFLTGYAFERQGAKPDYRHVADHVVRELVRQGCLLAHPTTAEKTWKMFRKYSGEVRLNYANNPLCPQMTSYTRKTGSATTYSKSVFEFLNDLLTSGIPPNIVVLAKTGIQLNRTRDVHHALQHINGIGPKIASLFLRDIAVMYNVFPAKDRHLLQPVDVWVKRAFEKLTHHHNLDIETIQRGIIKEAVRVGVLPEAVNQGMWYFSSQIADSEYRLSEALGDIGYANALLQEYIEAVRQEATAATVLERK